MHQSPRSAGFLNLTDLIARAATPEAKDRYLRGQIKRFLGYDVPADRAVTREEHDAMQAEIRRQFPREEDLTPEQRAKREEAVRRWEARIEKQHRRRLPAYEKQRRKRLHTEEVVRRKLALLPDVHLSDDEEKELWAALDADIRKQGKDLDVSALKKFIEKRNAEWDALMAQYPAWSYDTGEFPAQVDLKKLAKSKAPEIEHIVYPLLPAGEVTLWSSDGGTGKTFIAMGLSVDIALGRTWCGYDVEKPRKVIFLSFEDDTPKLHKRLEHICYYAGVALDALEGKLVLFDGARLEDPELMGANGEFGAPQLTKLYEWVRQLVSKHGRDVVLVIDGASDTFGGNEINRRQVRRFIRALRRLVGERGAVLLIAHVDKQTAKNPEGALGYSGSTAWNNSVRSRWYMWRDELDVLKLEQVKTNYARPGSGVAFQWDEGRRLFTGERVGGPGAKTAYEAQRDAADMDALISLFKQCESMGEDVPAADRGSRTAFTVLSAMPGFPRSLMNAKRFWQVILRMRAQSLISTLQIKRPRSSRPYTYLVLSPAPSASSPQAGNGAQS